MRRFVGRNSPLLFFIFFSIVGVEAQNADFRWEAGVLKICGDVSENGGLWVDTELIHFNWLINRTFFGFNIIKYNTNSFLKEDDDEETHQFTVLPLEIGFVLFNYSDWLFFSLYGRGGWQWTIVNDKAADRFYGSIGIQMFVFADLNFFYKPYLSLFAEYDTEKKIKIGLGFDFGLAMFIVGLGYKDKYDEYGSYWRQ